MAAPLLKVPMESDMSLFQELPGGSVIARAADSETMGGKPVWVQLLLDSAATHGAFSSLVVQLRSGANGANPHHHAGSTEMFYVLDGAVQILSGDGVVTAHAGDLASVPAGTCHAFAAAPGADAKLLIVITPGVERFEYFRHLARIAQGTEPPESILAVQERYDTWFDESEAWSAARTTR